MLDFQDFHLLTVFRFELSHVHADAMSPVSDACI